MAVRQRQGSRSRAAAAEGHTWERQRFEPDVPATDCDLATLGLVAGSLVGFAATAGAATIIRDTITTPFTETGIVDDCGRQGITGTLVGTDVITFQSVETSWLSRLRDGDRNGQITWTDGSYTIIESADHFSFNTGKAPQSKRMRTWIRATRTRLMACSCSGSRSTCVALHDY
jgi:hypothetical protein